MEGESVQYLEMAAIAVGGFNFPICTLAMSLLTE